MSVFEAGTRVHIVGVGGAGMSGLALLLSEMGADVSGSDATESAVLENLRARGIDVRVGHDASYVDGAQVVTWSPAVARDHVELVHARNMGAVMLTRSEALASLGSSKRVIGLTGTHGKTTATSMMVHISLAAGRDDSWLLGAPVLGVGQNGHWGSDDLLLEVDESYGTFELVAPYALGLLNVEADHLDHYGTLANVERAFGALVERTSGPVVAWFDDPGVQRVVAGASKQIVTVGTTDASQWRVRALSLERRASSCVVERGDVSLSLRLRVTGAHNVANAAVVAVVALELGIAPEAIERGLSNFLGAPRRFQYHGQWRGVDVYEDYAHLPGEIQATVRAAKDAGYERVIAVFQPHRVSRTLALGDAFAASFHDVDHVIVTDIYTAGEDNPTGVTGEVVADALRRDGVATTYVAGLNDVPEHLALLGSHADVLLVLGAGDVSLVIASLPGGLS